MNRRRVDSNQPPVRPEVRPAGPLLEAQPQEAVVVQQLLARMQPLGKQRQPEAVGLQLKCLMLPEELERLVE